jgi:serine/threonine protein kinase
MLPEADDRAGVDSFLKTIVRSGLLSKVELRAVLSTIPRQQQQQPQQLAKQLIRIGKLSWFQAHKLLQGAAAGLMIESFEVVAPIGKGGMGMVYLSRDRRDGRLLALKILPPKKAQREERMLARFRREMDISRRVSHRHIAETLATGEFQGVHYIAMEYIPGQTLYRLVTDRGPLAVPLAARLFAEAAAGLEYAHGRGVIHRDLKPSNIMVTPSGHAKILDLGLALIEGEIQQPREIIGGQGYVVGSMDYIAPEQTKDAVNVDARADIYGLGCTMYFALTGRPPFPGGTAKEKIQRHRKDEPTPLRQLNPSLPERFAALVTKMMAKNLEERYRHAADVREALQEWAVGVPEFMLEMPEEQSSQKAFEELRQASVSTELIEDPILALPSPTPPAVWPPFLARFLDQFDASNRVYIWVCLGIIGFWVLVLLVLAIVLLLR